MLINTPFILASKSLSRKKLLKNNNYLNFKQINPICNEEVYKKKLIKKKNLPNQIAIELSKLKAKSISKINKNILIVGLIQQYLLGEN